MYILKLHTKNNKTYLTPDTTAIHHVHVGVKWSKSVAEDVHRLASEKFRPPKMVAMTRTIAVSVISKGLTGKCMGLYYGTDFSTIAQNEGQGVLRLISGTILFVLDFHT